MSSVIETKAKKYLLKQFKSSVYKFSLAPAKSGYDLTMLNLKNNKKTRIELKSTNHKYLKSQIINSVVFSTEKEANLFITGKTKVLRLFMGSRPYILKLFDNSILGKEGKITVEYRSTIKGKKDHSKIIDIK